VSLIPLIMGSLKDSSFAGRMNADWNLVGFTNGVMDLRTMEFREIRPSDCITRALGYDYDPNPDLAEITGYLENIMPEKAKREYLIYKCSTFLNNRVPNDTLLFFLGTGGNGKSYFTNLLRGSFSNYSSSIKSSYSLMKIATKAIFKGKKSETWIKFNIRAWAS